MSSLRNIFLIEKLLEKVFLGMGYPSDIISDNGPQFRSDIFHKFCQEHGISHRRCSPFYPNPNASEHYIQNLKQMIRIFLNNKHNQWDKHLDKYLFCLRRLANEATGLSPSFAMYGRELLGDNVDECNKDEALSESYIRKRFRGILDLIHQNRGKLYLKNKALSNKDRRDISFKPSARALLRTHPVCSKINKFAAKLAPSFAGLFVVNPSE